MKGQRSLTLFGPMCPREHAVKGCGFLSKANNKWISANKNHFLIKVAATELQADTESKRQGPVEEATSCAGGGGMSNSCRSLRKSVAAPLGKCWQAKWHWFDTDASRQHAHLQKMIKIEKEGSASLYQSCCLNLSVWYWRHDVNRETAMLSWSRALL